MKFLAWTSFVLAMIFGALTFAQTDEPSESTQFGAKRLDFNIGEARAFVVLPTKAAVDGTKPWVWYSPTFIGRHPDPSHEWMAASLLDAGFAIAGVEVGESYGSPKGTQIYSELYAQMIAKGFDAKPSLLPQSRGGLMLLNWAAENAEKVACVAGIYTVCNLESYPGLDKACGAYEMSAEELKVQLGRYNPIERVKPLVDAKVPMLFIHGDSDTVVPIERNAGKFVERSLKLGGNARLITVPGKGHEVCDEFFKSEEFIAFLLSQGKSQKAHSPKK